MWQKRIRHCGLSSDIPPGSLPDLHRTVSGETDHLLHSQHKLHSSHLSVLQYSGNYEYQNKTSLLHLPVPHPYVLPEKHQILPEPLKSS